MVSGIVRTAIGPGKLEAPEKGKGIMDANEHAASRSRNISPSWADAPAGDKQEWLNPILLTSPENSGEAPTILGHQNRWSNAIRRGVAPRHGYPECTVPEDASRIPLWSPPRETRGRWPVLIRGPHGGSCVVPKYP